MLAEILIILALIAVNGVFAGAEIAVVSVRKTRLQELVQEGSAKARAVLALREDPERFLATVQVAITVVGATAAGFGGATLAEHLAAVLARADWLAPYSEELALTVVVAGITYCSVVIGELVPKSLALRGAERFSLLVARPLTVLAAIGRPVVWALSGTANLILKPFKDSTTFTETRYSADELQQLLAEAGREGTVHPEIGDIAARAIELHDLTVADIMIPRRQVVMLPVTIRGEALRSAVLNTPHSRLPVYDGRPDHVVGYVTVRDLLVSAWEQRDIAPGDVMRPPFFVFEAQPARTLLAEMRERHVPFAIVVDERGGLAGIATLEDLLEEIVGEIWSEHVKAIPPGVEREPDGSALVRGDLAIREVNRALAIDLPEDGPWRSLAGLCLAESGRIPAVGEVLALPGGILAEVVDASPRRIRMLRLRLPTPHRGA